jgi:hypothetical protein
MMTVDISITIGWKSSTKVASVNPVVVMVVVVVAAGLSSAALMLSRSPL